MEACQKEMQLKSEVNLVTTVSLATEIAKSTLKWEFKNEEGKIRKKALLPWISQKE